MTSSRKTDIEIGMEIGRKLAKSMMRRMLDTDDVVFEALYAEYESRSDAQSKAVQQALSMINPDTTDAEMIEDIGVEVAMLGNGADDNSRKLNVSRIQELAGMKHPTEEKIKALWRKGYEGKDALLSSMLNGGELQKTFENVTSFARQTPPSYPTNIPYAFRHFITTAEICLPKGYVDSDDGLEGFYYTQLLPGTAFTTFPSHADNVAPIHELMAYQGIAKYGQKLAEGFDQSGRDGLFLLSLNFAEKAILCQHDMISRTRKAVKDSQNSDKSLAEHVRHRLYTPMV